MAASEHSANEHDRLREAIDDIKDSAKETRTDVGALRGGFSDLRGAILGWKGEVEAKLVGYAIRIEALEKVRDKGEKNIADRVNVALNGVLTVLVLWTLYKVTGIKAP